MFKKVLLAFVIAVGILLAMIALQPATYAVTRSATIAAPPAAVFGYVNDFHQWERWSPWAKIDPAMKQTYEGPAAGTGAVYKWSGDDKAGAGIMTIIDSRPNERVAIDLAFTRPYASTCVIALDIRPDGSGSMVTWNMTGRNNFALKAISLFSSMDKMVGPDFERGLAQLRSLAESSGRQ
ncbi:MAG: SRPBCC family protein [Acidobacteriota bacterium]